LHTHFQRSPQNQPSIRYSAQDKSPDTQRSIHYAMFSGSQHMTISADSPGNWCVTIEEHKSCEIILKNITPFID